MGSAKIYLVYLLFSTMLVSTITGAQYVGRRLYHAAAHMMGLQVPNRYHIKEVRFDRTSWDEISVYLVVEEKATGAEVKHLPVPHIQVLDINKNVMVEGIGYDIPVPDRNLLPQQPYTVVISTYIEGERVAASESFKASNKTVLTDLELTYPAHKNLLAGECAFNYQIFREDFNDAQYYEPISVNNVTAILVANKGTDKEMEVALAKGRGEFTFTGSTNYNAYKQYVLTNLTGGSPAKVMFTPVLQWNGTEEVCNGKEIAITMDGVKGNDVPAEMIKPAKAVYITENHVSDVPPKGETPAIKQPVPTQPPVKQQAAGNVNEITAYAQRAAHKIMNKYDAEIAAGCKATIKTWKYDAFMGQYTATITTTWYNKYMPEEVYKVEGTLTVAHDGKAAQFTRTSVNQTIAEIEKYNGVKLGKSEQLASLN